MPLKSQNKVPRKKSRPGLNLALGIILASAGPAAAQTWSDGGTAAMVGYFGNPDHQMPEEQTLAGQGQETETLQFQLGQSPGAPVGQSGLLGGVLDAPPQADPDDEQVEVLLEAAQPISIKADEIEDDRNQKLTHFIGHVKIRRGAEFIVADRAVWNNETNTAELSGNVKLTNEEVIMLAHRAVMNLDLKMAKVYDGRAFFPAQNYYLSGVVIERLGDKVYEVRDGSATTCDGPDPAWTIEASRITVKEGGYATASGVTLKSGRIPFLASPYFVFPVKNERQSGLLSPSIGNSSRDGFTFVLPLYWATGENHDVTYTPVWRNDRGLSHTLEARYHFGLGQGIWQYSYLKDDKPQFFENTGSGRPQWAKHRYWLRAQNRWQVGDWDINMLLDKVSDPLYLNEFRNDLDGYYESSRLFSSKFGSTVNEALDPVRTSYLFAQKSDYDTLLRGGVTYNDDSYREKNRDSIQRLPSLQYNIVSRPLAATSGLDQGGGLSNPPRFSMNVKYDYFNRLTDQYSRTDETGHRVIMNPSLTWSSPLADLATFKLDGDLDLAMYSANGYRPNDGTWAGRRDARHGGNDNRLSGSLEASLSTTLSRVFEGGLGKSVATRHQITPTVSLQYVEAPNDQIDLAYWDFQDRRLPRRSLRYGFLNTFVSKTPVLDKNEDLTGYNYFQFLKVGLWSSYEFADNTEWASKPNARYYSSTAYFDEGAGPVELEVEAYFNSYLSARLISDFDSRSGKATSHDLSLKVTDPRGDFLRVTYDYDSAATALGLIENRDYEEIRSVLGLVLNTEWRADFSTRYDLIDKRSRESNARLRYQAQCYGLSFIYSKTDGDRKIGLMVDLMGLGSIGYNPGGFFY